MDDPGPVWTAKYVPDTRPSNIVMEKFNATWESGKWVTLFLEVRAFKIYYSGVVLGRKTQYQRPPNVSFD